MNLTLEEIFQLEIELKKRWAYHYHRWRVQNDEWDKMTRFVYNIRERDACVEAIKRIYEEKNIRDKSGFFNYSANRRYNFRSAQWTENLFKLHENVVWEEDEHHQFIDFYIEWLPFDLKTSVFPREYNNSIEYAKENKWDLINWLYNNQSKQQRFHMKNRLFMIVHSQNWENRKLKAELRFLKPIIDEYLANYSKDNLYSFIHDGETIYSDTIRVED